MKKVIFILFIIIFIPNFALAWDDCPFGLINDPAPGSCGRFIDTDRDGFCDHSQLALGKRANVAELSGIDTDTKMPQAKKVGYRVFSVAWILLLLYVFSWWLARSKVISVVTHRRIWNLALLATFLVSGLLGLLLLLGVNYDWKLALPFNMLYWHVETGIAAAVIAVFHIGWHWRYFVSMLKRRGGKSNVV